MAASAACADGGKVAGEIHGAIESTLDWRDGDLECDGMARPDGEGARLRFAGPATSGGEKLQLAFIIALPRLERGQSARELEAGVTLMEESTGVFFSTPDPSTCWADIESQVPLSGDVDDTAEEYRITGLLYCLSPLAEVHGSRSVTLGDLEFSGRLDWRVPE